MDMTFWFPQTEAALAQVAARSNTTAAHVSAPHHDQLQV
jgi:hypothetical protein